jgi:hypothetical protein
MSTRCKFRLDSIKQTANTAKEYQFYAVHDSSLPEDASFTKYTPFGVLNVSIDNPTITPMLEIGKYYYLDLTPVPVA